MRKLSVVFALAVMMTCGADAFAGCQSYFCDSGPDGAECLTRYDIKHNQAADCQAFCDCMPDPAQMGNLLCSCYCSYDSCYNV